MTAFLTFLVSSLVIIVAGIFLAKCADRFARVTGLGGLLVGSIFLAAATSLPELMVDISAVRQGTPNLAVGNLFGACLFNLLILALCDLFHKSRGRMLSPASVAHALSATQCTAMMALAGLGIVIGPKLMGFEIGRVGPSSVALMVAYLLGIRLVFVNQRADTVLRPSSESNDKKEGPSAIVRPLLGYVSTAAIILLAAPYVASSSAEIAEITGLGNTFIGTTLVALCTTLPELVASITAVRMGAYDLALGNIFGSNAFNMLLIVPLDFIYSEPLLASVAPTHLITCLSSIVVTAVAVMGQLFQVERRKLFVEPDAILIVTLVLSAMAGVYYLR